MSRTPCERAARQAMAQDEKANAFDLEGPSNLDIALEGFVSLMDIALEDLVFFFKISNPYYEKQAPF